jgi:hypothetical protein
MRVVGERRDGALLSSGRGKRKVMAASGGGTGGKRMGRGHPDRGTKWVRSFLGAAVSSAETDCRHGRSDMDVRPSTSSAFIIRELLR